MRVRDLRLGPRIGICVVVIATSAGELLYLFALRPEGRNCRTWFHRFLSSPLQFHSSFRKEGGKLARVRAQRDGKKRLTWENHSRFCRMNATFQSGNRDSFVLA